MSWRDRAACAGLPIETFYPRTSGGRRRKDGTNSYAAEAKKVCADCPVRADCLTYVLDVEASAPRFGVWGGLTAAERHRLTKASH